ncbi:MAG: LysE family transporter [Candidatus Berkiella sp.]
MTLEKIVLGVTLAAPIGPVSLEMIKRGLRNGFLGAFIVRLGGAVGNTLCLVTAYFGLALFTDSGPTLALCSLAGSFVLIYLGLKSFLDKRSHLLSLKMDIPRYSLGNGLLTGFILSIANPIAVIFWLSIFAATLNHGHQSNLVGLMENFAIVGGVILWGGFLSGLLELGKRFFNQKLIQIITMAAGVMLIYFGLKYGYKAVGQLWELMNAGKLR